MSVSWESLANDHILGIAPYEPGKPIEELERELGLRDVIKLASNETPLPPADRPRARPQARLKRESAAPVGPGHEGDAERAGPHQPLPGRERALPAPGD